MFRSEIITDSAMPAGRMVPLAPSFNEWTRDVWAVRYWAILGAVSGVALAIAAAQALTPSYRASAQIFIDPQNLQVLERDLSPTIASGDAGVVLIESQARVMASDSVLRATAQQLGLGSDPEFVGSGNPLKAWLDGLSRSDAPRDPLGRATTALGKAVHVVRLDRTYVVDVHAQSESATKAAAIANAVVGNYLALRESQRAEQAGRASGALEGRLAQLLAELEAAENAVEAFKSANAIVETGGQSLLEGEVGQANQAAVTANNAVEAAQIQLTQLRALLVDPARLAASPEAMGSPDMTRLRAELQAAAGDVAVLGASFGARHPRLLAAEERLAGAEAAITAESARLLAADHYAAAAGVARGRGAGHRHRRVAAPPGRLMRRRALLAGLAGLGALPVRAHGTGRIKIVGNRLEWQGAPLRLAGIAMGDPVYIRVGRSLDDYRVVARDWAANCVRISVHPGHWRYDRLLLAQLLDADIAAARAQDLFVIVDWHAIGFPGRYEPVPPPEWRLPPDAYLASIADAMAFWSEMADRHGGDGAVIFEIWNEPVGDAQHWVSDGAYWPLFNAAWQEIIAAIRARSDSIVLVAGGRWAHDLTGAAADPLDDPRSGYAWHVYPNEDRHDPDRWFKSLGTLPAHRPIVVAEWGFCSPCSDGLAGGVDDFAIPFTRDVLDGLGLGHTAWCYSPGAMPALLAADGTTPSEYGSFVRDYLRGQA